MASFRPVASGSDLERRRVTAQKRAGGVPRRARAESCIRLVTTRFMPGANSDGRPGYDSAVAGVA
jgi:hypothetical protein